MKLISYSNNLYIFLQKLQQTHLLNPTTLLVLFYFYIPPIISQILLSSNNLTKQLTIKENSFMTSNNNKNNLQKMSSSNQFTQSISSVTPTQLETLYQEHWQMKQEIHKLKYTLDNCQNKWNMIVNSLLKQNVQLKASEEYYKNKYHHLQEKILSKKHKKHQQLKTPQRFNKNSLPNQQLQLKTSSHPSTLSSYNLSTASHPNSESPSLRSNNLNDTQISSVQNLWKNYYVIDDNESQHSFNNISSKKYQ